MEYIATSKNGQKVYIDTDSSHAATHIVEYPDLLALVKEVIENTALDKEELMFERDMGRKVGEMNLVETDENDEIIYAKRKNRDTYTRFVKNRKPVTTTYVTLIVNKIDEGYELFSAWLGGMTPAFPGSEWETPKSKEFWSNHALIWGTQEIQKDTETEQQPW